MAFALFLVYLVLSYVRPWELNESLLSLPIIPIASVAALGATLIRLLVGRGPTFRSPQPYLALLFLAWAVCSFVLATRWFGGACPRFAPARHDAVSGPETRPSVLHRHVTCPSQHAQ